jgi:hypothetical protein
MATPTLTTHFKSDHEDTTKILESLWAEIDKRKDGSKDWKAGYRVLSGIFALRHVDEFAVSMRQLSKPNQKAFELIKDQHMGKLLQRTKGKNRYRVNPEFPQTFVIDTSENNLRFRMVGQGVSYTDPDSIPTAESVRIINNSRAVICNVLDIATSIQMILNKEPFPARYQRLPEIQLKPKALNLTKDFIRFVDHELIMRDVVALRIRPSQDPNRITYVAATPAAIDFGHRIKNLAFRFMRENRLAHIVPAVEFKQQERDFTTIDDGQNYSQNLSGQAA